MIWTDDQISELKRLWERGDSATIIGAAMNLTRNSILGKVHRLRLPHRQNVAKCPYERVSAPRSRSKTAIKVRLAASLNRERPMRLPVKVKTFALKIDSEPPTKNELRAMLRQAVINTAAMS